MSNVIKATFDGSRYCYTTSLFQWDYGQILEFTDITLDDGFEVHFGNVGASETVSATGANNQVAIPDACLETSGLLCAYVFLHTGENDGETAYVANILVNARPQPHQEPEPEPTPEPTEEEE